MENKVITVYMESTPNPAAMKFVTNTLLLAQGDREYFSKTDAIDCPLAAQLFDFTAVKSVFISGYYVTVIKDQQIDWFEIQGMIREFIRGYLMSGDPVFSKKAEAGEPPQASENNLNIPAEANTTPPNETEARIASILDEYVKPAVEQDGGAIDFKSFNDGIVTVKLRGSCSGCPSSVVTLKSGIERLLKQMIPEVQEVVAEDE